jgi:hypothetical protein
MLKVRILMSPFGRNVDCDQLLLLPQRLPFGEDVGDMPPSDGGVEDEVESFLEGLDCGSGRRSAGSWGSGR